MKRTDAIELIKKIEGEFQAARFALAYTQSQISTNPGLLNSHAGLSIADLNRVVQTVEVVFTVRLYAQFEATLRGYWATRWRTHPKMEVLLERIATKVNMPKDWLDAADGVRDYRNDIVHHGLVTPIITLQQCRGHICRYLSQLPMVWP